MADNSPQKKIRKFNSIAEAQNFQGTPKIKKNPSAKKQIPAFNGPKLSKKDPDYYSKIGKISGAKRLKKDGTNYFSNIAKLSHPRAEYRGGRPKKRPEIPVDSSHGELADA